MKHVIAFAAIGASLLVSSTGMTLAQKAPVTGQPGTNNGQNCDLTTGPVPGGLTGGAATKSQSPFNLSASSGPNSAGAGGQYANTFNGSGSSQHSNNLSATSQYDIACAHTKAP